MTSTLLLYLVAELTFAMACQRGFTPKTHAADDPLLAEGWGCTIDIKELAWPTQIIPNGSTAFIKCVGEFSLLEFTWRRVQFADHNETLYLDRLGVVLSLHLGCFSYTTLHPNRTPASARHN